MSFDVPDGFELQIKEYAHARHISHDEAVFQLIQAGLERITSSLPVSVKSRGPRTATRPPNLTVAEEFPIFGVFADKPEFSAEIDKIFSGRGKRYVNFA